MTKLTKQEQAEAWTKAELERDMWGESCPRNLRITYLEHNLKVVEALHASGFEIVRKEQEDG